jgi:hypothetical protein
MNLMEPGTGIFPAQGLNGFALRPPQMGTVIRTDDMPSPHCPLKVAGSACLNVSARPRWMRN